MSVSNLYLVVLIWLAAMTGAIAQPNPIATFDAALAAQTKENNAAKSIALYQELVQSEQLSPEVFNNLGLAYLSNNQLGKAIVSFERALWLQPNHADAQYNLQAAQQRIVSPIAATESAFFVRWWNAAIGVFSSTSWAIIFLLLFAIAIGALGTGHWLQKPIFRAVAIGVLLVSIFPFVFGWQQRAILFDQTKAIIIKKEVGLRQNPQLVSPEMELIHEGIAVRILEEKNTWTKVQLPNYLVGWIPSKMIVRVKKL